MAKTLLRCIATLPNYPYHSQPRTQRFTDFPLHFNSPKPAFFQPGNSEFLTGAIAAFHTLLTLMTQTPLTDLDTVAEWNLSQHLKTHINQLHSDGYRLKSTGSDTTTQAVALSVQFTGGSLFPYRNLNQQANEYLHTSKMMNQAQVDFFFLRKSEKIRNVNRLISIDLKELNRKKGGESESEVKQIQTGLKLIPLIMKTVDVGFVSTHKLHIVSDSGETVDGDSAADTEEFHTIRLEKVLEPRLGVLKWIPPWKTYKEWLERQMQELTQWTIVDVDGCMGGNPLAK